MHDYQRQEDRSSKHADHAFVHRREPQGVGGESLIVLGKQLPEAWHQDGGVPRKLGSSQLRIFALVHGSPWLGPRNLPPLRRTAYPPRRRDRSHCIVQTYWRACFEQMAEHGNKTNARRRGASCGLSQRSEGALKVKCGAATEP